MHTRIAARSTTYDLLTSASDGERSLAYLAAPSTRHALDAMSSPVFHDHPVFPRGFRCASRNVGLKPKARDLALFASDVDAAAAAIFTRNHFPGAPVVVGREIM